MSLHFAKLVFLSPIATGLRAVFAETEDNRPVVMPKAASVERSPSKECHIKVKSVKPQKTPFRIMYATT